MNCLKACRVCKYLLVILAYAGSNDLAKPESKGGFVYPPGTPGHPAASKTYYLRLYRLFTTSRCSR